MSRPRDKSGGGGGGAREKMCFLTIDLLKTQNVFSDYRPVTKVLCADICLSVGTRVS